MIGKKTTNNPISRKHNKCFQYAVTLVWNHEGIGKNPEKKNKKNKLFINKYKWEGINFPSEKTHWKKIEKNNVTIALNVLYAK